jgi:hypothetical protein
MARPVSGETYFVEDAQGSVWLYQSWKDVPLPSSWEEAEQAVVKGDLTWVHKHFPSWRTLTFYRESVAQDTRDRLRLEPEEALRWRMAGRDVQVDQVHRYVQSRGAGTTPASQRQVSSQLRVQAKRIAQKQLPRYRRHPHHIPQYCPSCRSLTEQVIMNMATITVENIKTCPHRDEPKHVGRYCTYCKALQRNLPRAGGWFFILLVGGLFLYAILAHFLHPPSL